MIKTELEFSSEALATFLTKGFTMAGDIVTPVDASEKVPSKENWDAKVVELKAEYSAQEYARNRSSSSGYPSIPDQLDEIYHNGIDSWKAVIKVTKDKYPKG